MNGTWRQHRESLWIFVFASALAACEEKPKSQPGPPSDASQPSAASPSPEVRPTAAPEPSDKSGEKEPPSCPSPMALIPGGEFWVGTEREVYEREENPRFRARLAPFCVDRLEVSTEEYEACMKAGKCSEPHGGRHTCNSVEKGRGNHPINCIDHAQARAVCAARGARLLTEVEWEYLARGGAEMRDFPWGKESPDGNTCWKSALSCERGKFAEEAFGLHDVVGNVWEWTDSWFGPYPWPQQSGRHRVYRGGSWSRRFEKWMRPTLRNRMPPEDSGSHLGTRCAFTLPGTECPGVRLENGACSHEILEVSCLDGQKWNGVRCAPPSDKSKCDSLSDEVPGYGCVRGKVEGPANDELATDDVKWARSPEFDSDCEKNSPGRPKAYRFTGGGHLARNAVGKKLGCKNRDVGVGFNSSCCPQ